ncbi:DUF6631 family protein [Ectopseudomonas oleovorans]|uniref:Uncharacterized protein n=1 Tax=Ectopseudomonas oleovorans (strain CECT 5344) TaxID=1182590 RepID=W6QZY3_ECTO5|nr:DUF6631 family protein [Pseudomonas oleovorans]CDM42385.1 hypothetical protein BN5_3843 [Pseudomonas oleovorans CECT 5344]CDR93008.1 hypothetical protein PPSAL_3784 [Pseudomonas oleovorans]
MTKRRVKPQQPDDSLEVLFPDRPLTVGGRDLVVRELGFEEQMHNNHLLKPIADAFCQIPPQVLASPDSINQVLDLLAAHWDNVRELVAISCGQPLKWVKALPPADGEALVLTWWTANQGFFVRRLWRPALLAQARKAPAGAESSPASSPQATTGTSSAATPSGS